MLIDKIKEKIYYLPFVRNMSDETYCKLHYYKTTKRKLNLDNPQTYTEKLNWLKLYNHDPKFTLMVDKYEAKNYAREIIGDKYIIETYGVYESFDEIDFSTLPDQFVLKCTHDSGGYAICKDKANFDFEKAKKTLNNHLKRNFYYTSREWPYKNVKPRIIAEKYIEGLMKEDSVEYKITCYDGKVEFYTICTGIAHAFEERKNDFYDANHNHMPFHTTYNDNASVEPKIPKEIDEMIELSEKLSKGIPHLRVDWYLRNNKILLGEMTFYSWGGFMNWNDVKYDYELGKNMKLPSEKRI